MIMPRIRRGHSNSERGGDMPRVLGLEVGKPGQEPRPSVSRCLVSANSSSHYTFWFQSPNHAANVNNNFQEPHWTPQRDLGKIRPLVLYIHNIVSVERVKVQ